MSIEPRAMPSGAALARLVRGLGTQAHRVLRDAESGRPVDEREVHDLLERIRDLTQGLRGAQKTELRRWLKGLASQLEGVREAEAGALVGCS